MNRNYILLKLSLDTLKYFKESQCLKIMGKVSYNIASVESYVHILSGQKFIKNAKNGPSWRKIKNATFLVIFKHCDFWVTALPDIQMFSLDVFCLRS